MDLYASVMESLAIGSARLRTQGGGGRLVSPTVFKTVQPG